jgi:hypothetical protein
MMRKQELAKKFNLKDNQKITFLTVPEWKPYFQLNLDTKITASLRKEISKRLYQSFGVKKPIKRFVKVDDRRFLGIQNDIVCEVRWHIFYPSVYIETIYSFSKEEKSFPDPNYPAYFEPSLNIRRLDLSDYSDVAHPLHSWFVRGASDGYSNGYWDRGENEDYIASPDFPSKEAEQSYQRGYENGFANGMMDE